MFDLIVGFISESAYFGVFALMALENILPPIPSELIMPMAGFSAAQGSLNLAGVLAAGTAGSVIGTLPWYYAGRMYGMARLKNLAAEHGRWLTLGPGEIEKAMTAFQRHGRKAVFFGRLVPSIRTLISVPAGIANMPLPQYLLYSSLGSLIWTGLLAALGFALQSQYDLLAHYLGPVSEAIVATIAVLYLYRVANYRPKKAG